MRQNKRKATQRNCPGVRPPVTRCWRTSMAKRSFVQKTQRTIVGAAKSGVARVQEIELKGIMLQQLQPPSCRSSGHEVDDGP